MNWETMLTLVMGANLVVITETDLISGLYRQSFAGERKSA